MVSKNFQFFRVKTADEMEAAIIYAYANGYKRKPMHISSLEKAISDYRKFWETYRSKCILELSPAGDISYGTTEKHGATEIYLTLSIFDENVFTFE